MHNHIVKGLALAAALLAPLLTTLYCHSRTLAAAQGKRRNEVR